MLVTHIYLIYMPLIEQRGTLVNQSSADAVSATQRRRAQSWTVRVPDRHHPVWARPDPVARRRVVSPGQSEGRFLLPLSALRRRWSLHIAPAIHWKTDLRRRNFVAGNRRIVAQTSVATWLHGPARTLPWLKRTRPLWNACGGTGPAAQLSEGME